MKRRNVVLVVGMMMWGGCTAPEETMEQAAEIAAEPTLGPVDGHELSPTDLDRVQVGELAPDFTLTALNGPAVSLSDYRGEKNVVLVFYRGHW